MCNPTDCVVRAYSNLLDRNTHSMSKAALLSVHGKCSEECLIAPGFLRDIGPFGVVPTLHVLNGGAIDAL